MILAPIVGGLGTVFGPVVGAFILTPLGEGLIALTERFGINAPGAKAVFYGARPDRDHLLPAERRVAVARAPARPHGAPAMTALLVGRGVSKRFRGLARGRRA